MKPLYFIQKPSCFSIVESAALEFFFPLLLIGLPFRFESDWKLKHNSYTRNHSSGFFFFVDTKQFLLWINYESYHCTNGYFSTGFDNDATSFSHCHRPCVSRFKRFTFSTTHANNPIASKSNSTISSTNSTK